MHKPDRIGLVTEHARHVLPELRRLGFRTMVQRRKGRTSAPGALLKRGNFSLYVLLPHRSVSGVVVAWEGNGAQGVRIIERGWPVHIGEAIALVNGGLYMIEQLSS